MLSDACGKIAPVQDRVAQGDAVAVIAAEKYPGTACFNIVDDFAVTRITQLVLRNAVLKHCSVGENRRPGQTKQGAFNFNIDATNDPEETAAAIKRRLGAYHSI